MGEEEDEVNGDDHTLTSMLPVPQPKPSLLLHKPTIALQQQHSNNPQPRRVAAIFWDYENVALPAWCASPVEACRALVAVVAANCGPVRHRRVYADYSRNDTGAAVMAGIAASGFSLVSTPRQGATKRKETLDRKLMADMIVLAWDHAANGSSERLCVVLIASDGDYAYALNTLRDRGVTNLVIYRSEAAQLLTASADVALDLEKDVLCDIERKRKGMRESNKVTASHENGDHASEGPSQDVVTTVDSTTPNETTRGREKPNQLTEEEVRRDAQSICRLMVEKDVSTSGDPVAYACNSWTRVGALRRTFLDSYGKQLDRPIVRFRLAVVLAIREGWVLRGKQKHPQQSSTKKKKLSSAALTNGPAVVVMPLSAADFQERMTVSNAMSLQMTPFGYAKIDPNFPVPVDQLEL